MSGLKHLAAVTRFCRVCMMAMEDISNLLESDNRYQMQIKSTKEKCACLNPNANFPQKKQVAKEKWDFVRATEDKWPLLSLRKWKSLLEHGGLKMQDMFLDVYALFTFDPIHNLYLGVPNMLGETCLRLCRLKRLKPAGEGEQGSESDWYK